MLEKRTKFRQSSWPQMDFPPSLLSMYHSYSEFHGATSSPACGSPADAPGASALVGAINTICSPGMQFVATPGVLSITQVLSRLLCVWALSESAKCAHLSLDAHGELCQDTHCSVCCRHPGPPWGGAHRWCPRCTPCIVGKSQGL